LWIISVELLHMRRLLKQIYVFLSWRLYLDGLSRSSNPNVRQLRNPVAHVLKWCMDHLGAMYRRGRMSARGDAIVRRWRNADMHCVMQLGNLRGMSWCGDAGLWQLRDAVAHVFWWCVVVLGTMHGRGGLQVRNYTVLWVWRGPDLHGDVHLGELHGVFGKFSTTLRQLWNADANVFRWYLVGVGQLHRRRGVRSRRDSVMSGGRVANLHLGVCVGSLPAACMCHCPYHVFSSSLDGVW
jgi:hypothetical protein